MITLTLEIQNNLFGMLAVLSRNSTDLRPAWPLIAEEFYRIEEEQFDSQGARVNQWAELSHGYAKWKAINYPGQPILQRTGALKNSLTNQHDANAIYDAQSDSLTLGTSLGYAQYHQAGEGKLPQRPPIELRDDDFQKLGEIARDELQDMALELGFGVVGFLGFGGRS